MTEDELTPAEREALRALPREAQPGDLLEERTVRALREAGLLGRRRPGRWRPQFIYPAAAAACVLFFVAGFAVGQGRKAPASAQWSAETTRERSQPASRQESTPRNPTSATTVAQSESGGADGLRYVVWF
jgi:hypothetical protein